IEDFAPRIALGKSKEIETPQNKQCASRNRRELCKSREAGIFRPRDGQNERKNGADQSYEDEKDRGGMFCRKSQSEGDGACDDIFQAQSWKARAARTRAVADSSETGKSVITTGKCAATVGSIARKSTVPSATPGPKVRRMAKASVSNSNPFSVHIAIRARRCTELKSLLR